jgi:hypothetical protein
VNIPRRHTKAREKSTALRFELKGDLAETVKRPCSPKAKNLDFHAARRLINWPDFAALFLDSLFSLYEWISN